jgi:hypothetical protein
MKLLPKAVRALIGERGNSRGIPDLLKRDYPNIYAGLLATGLSMREALYLSMGNKPGVCRCGNKPRFIDVVKGYKVYCSRTCAQSDSLMMERKKQTCLKNWGTTHHMKNRTISAKVEQSKINHFGTNAIFTIPEIKEKARLTSQRKFGADTYAESKDFQKAKAVISAKAQKSRQRTFKKRYGVEHPLQVREIFDRQQAAAHTRKCVKIGDHEFYVQGYEDLVLQWLHEERNIKPRQIAVTADEGVPTVWYKDRGKNRAYFPDMLLTSAKAQVLIEVKSDHTMGLLRPETGVFRVTHLKLKATYESGHKLWLFIVVKARKHNQRIVRIEDPGQYTAAQLRKILKEKLQAP